MEKTTSLSDSAVSVIYSIHFATTDILEKDSYKI